VVVTEEADAWSNSCQKHIKARRFTDVTGTPTMPLETDTGWSVMGKDYVHAACARKPFNLVRCVVSLGVSLEPVRLPSVVRRAIATTDTTDPNGVPTLISEVERAPVLQIDQTGEHFRIMSPIEPLEVFMVTLYEKSRPRRPPTFPEPCGKVTRAVVTASRLVDPVRIGPDTEIAHVQHVVEANAE
jgi:hypothetical protein